MPQILDDLTNEEFDQLIERYIERSAEWDGALPLDTMLETGAAMERSKQPLLGRVCLIEGRIALETPPASPLTVREPHTLVLEDGSELTLEFEESLLETA